MSRDAYFTFLNETAEVVAPLIGEFLEPYEERHPALYNELMLFAGTRLSRPLQKPALFRLAFELCGGQKWEQFAPVAAAFEILNISSYQANAAFDAKLGTITDEQKDAQFISAMISREISARVVESCVDLCERVCIPLQRAMSGINEHIYLAQYCDLFILTWQRRHEYLAAPDKYMSDYIERCRLGSGIFNSEVAKWGAVLAGADDLATQAVAGFGDHFGVALQIANDIGDYVPAGADLVITRDYQDQLSDLRNGRLTFMLFKLLTCAAPLSTRLVVERSVAGRGASASDLAEVSRLCVETGAFRDARELAGSHVRQALGQIEAFRGATEYELLGAMASIALHNKYFVALKQIGKQAQSEELVREGEG